MKKIDPASLVPMDVFSNGREAIRIDLAYAGPRSFCGIIYRPDARLWLHEDLAAITLLAAGNLNTHHGLRLVIYDGLRTVTAQEAMLQTPVVQKNPQWLEGDDRVLSPPGGGGHPRAMAVDVALEDKHGNLLDMGTEFDEFPANGPGPETNRAHRKYSNLNDNIKANRKLLEDTMMDAATDLGLPFLALPVEWWDFRFPGDIVRSYAPLDDRDLPPQMRMTARHIKHRGLPDFPQSHFDTLMEKTMLRVRAVRAG